MRNTVHTKALHSASKIAAQSVRQIELVAEQRALAELNSEPPAQPKKTPARTGSRAMATREEEMAGRRLEQLKRIGSGFRQVMHPQDRKVITKDTTDATSRAAQRRLRQAQRAASGKPSQEAQ